MTESKQAAAASSAKIVKVGALAKDALDINFDNGSILILSVDLILGLPGFSVLTEDDRIYYPKTDGNSIYCRDGPRALSIQEILELTGRTVARREEVGKEKE